MVWSVLLLLVSFGIIPDRSFAQALSSALGATKLDGLKNFSECQNQVLGHREHLIGDRLEAKLAISTALKPEEHDIWAAQIRALQQVTASRPYKAPDEKNSQRYFLGLTNDEQVAINSMHTRFTQEVNLACEKIRQHDALLSKRRPFRAGPIRTGIARQHANADRYLDH